MYVFKMCIFCQRNRRISELPSKIHQSILVINVVIRFLTQNEYTRSYTIWGWVRGGVIYLNSWTLQSIQMESIYEFRVCGMHDQLLSSTGCGFADHEAQGFSIPADIAYAKAVLDDLWWKLISQPSWMPTSSCKMGTNQKLFMHDWDCYPIQLGPVSI